MSEWTDGDYPTQAALDRIETWSYRDVDGAFDFIKTIWHWPDFASHQLSMHEAAILRATPGERYLRLGTGGWSGNESIVSALNRNRMIMAMAWRLSTVGGLHIFQYPNPSGKYPIHAERMAVPQSAEM